MAEGNNGSERHNSLRHKCGLFADLAQYFKYCLLLVRLSSIPCVHITTISEALPQFLGRGWLSGKIFLQDFEEAYPYAHTCHQGMLPIDKNPSKAVSSAPMSYTM